MAKGDPRLFEPENPVSAIIGLAWAHQRGRQLGTGNAQHPRQRTRARAVYAKHQEAGAARHNSADLVFHLGLQERWRVHVTLNAFETTPNGF